MLTSLRAELNALLLQAAPRRRPAVRRASQENWLFATDVPLLVHEGELARLLQSLESGGWHGELRDGWLYLAHALPKPVHRPLHEPEGACGCVLSVLRRHPESSAVPDELLYGLAKAAEQGTAKLEKYCETLHRQLAQQLRRRNPLPAGLIPYLLEAAACAEKSDAKKTMRMGEARC